nr:MAG TPA: hypothetical protein [Bacteriophage sp.]
MPQNKDAVIQHPPCLYNIPPLISKSLTSIMKNKRKNRVLHIRRHILITRRIYISNLILT